MKTIRDIAELTPTAQKACGLFLQRCKEKGLPVYITETYRPQERQDELYAQGRTKPGKVVTWTKNSRHKSRRAWDICKLTGGKADYSDAAFFKACGNVAKELDITWGGSWKTPDMPHFEIAETWTEPALRRILSAFASSKVWDVMFFPSMLRNSILRILNFCNAVI